MIRAFPLFDRTLIEGHVSADDFEKIETQIDDAKGEFEKKWCRYDACITYGWQLKQEPLEELQKVYDIVYRLGKYRELIEYRQFKSLSFELRHKHVRTEKTFLQRVAEANAARDKALEDGSAEAFAEEFLRETIEHVNHVIDGTNKYSLAHVIDTLPKEATIYEDSGDVQNLMQAFDQYRKDLRETAQKAAEARREEMLRLLTGPWAELDEKDGKPAIPDFVRVKMLEAYAADGEAKLFSLRGRLGNLA